MAATADLTTPVDGAVQSDSSTREQILRLVVESGPVSVVELAGSLGLSAAGVRRHVAGLEAAGQVVEHKVTASGPSRRGRPARRFVATDRGQASLTSAYADIAGQALRYLGEILGTEAVEAFAARRAVEIRDRHPELAESSGLSTHDRVEALAEALAADGYATSVRPVPGGRAVQLCQGHCPVQDVAAQFPQLCEAESKVFSEVLGVHVQRLSTLASGGHVCTTHVPMTTPSVRAATECPAPAATVEGTR